MKDNNYSKQITVSVNTEKVFKALNEGLNMWWGKTSNTAYKKGGQFTITFENGYWWTFKIIEYTPNKELIWKCVDGKPDFNKEWIGHTLHWTIDEINKATTINFHQTGLNPKTSLSLTSLSFCKPSILFNKILFHINKSPLIFSTFSRPFKFPST